MRRTVDALVYEGVEAWLWDSDLPGFGVRVRKSGRKFYYAQYRAGGRGTSSRRVTLGMDGVLTPDQARSAAHRVLASVRLGGDPAGERNYRREEPTISNVCDRYLREHVAAHNKPTTAVEVKRIVEARIRPSLGGTRVSALTRARVKEWHSDMHDAPYEANRCLAYLSKMMTLAAKDWELRSDNPCSGIKRFPERARERFFNDAELQRVGAALRLAEEQGADPSCIGAIRLLAVTGLRVSEALGLRWDDVDAGASCLRLRDAKAGARTVPLGGAALLLLSEFNRQGPYVLPAADRREPLSVSTLRYFWDSVRVKADVADGRLHDFRHTAGTFAAQTGANAFMVRDLLGHKTLAMTGRYVERAIDPMRATADAVAGRVGAALGGTNAEVVSLRQVV